MRLLQIILLHLDTRTVARQTGIQPPSVAWLVFGGLASDLYQTLQLGSCTIGCPALQAKAF
jgi:hypothetical protein